MGGKKFLKNIQVIQKPPHSMLWRTFQLQTQKIKGYEKQRRVGKIAEGVLKIIPDHPGAHHYMIHAYDYPELAPMGLEISKSYGEIAPEVPHALHMPSHIFYSSRFVGRIYYDEFKVCRSCFKTSCKEYYFFTLSSCSGLLDLRSSSTWRGT